MAKKSHNKKRNVGVIYELLIRRISEALVEGDQKTAAKCTKILKEHYKKGSEIYKEFRLFNSLVKTHIDSDSLATRIIHEAKLAAKSHDTKRLRTEKSALIKSINYDLAEPKFYSQFVKEYTKYATVQTLLNEWRTSAQTDFGIQSEYENKVHTMLLAEKKEVSLSAEKTDNVSSLTVKIMTEKFNKVYGQMLNEDQQALIREYVFSLESGSSEKFKSKIQLMQEQALKDLSIFSKTCNNKVLSEKINSVQKNLKQVDLNRMDDQTMAKFLSISKLCEELQGE